MNSAAELLGDHGPFPNLIPDFKSRSGQQELAEAIQNALMNETSLVCEAGTGTGKTFAYLVPVLLSGRKVIISTGTKHLQDQIYFRDLPIVQKALQASLSATLLKGRNNYLCLHRFKHAGAAIQSPALYDELEKVRQWSTATERGDLSECLPEAAAIRPLVSSTQDNCLGQECADYENCYVLKARRRAAKADIIVVNHHLLLADMHLRETGFGELLPDIDAIIFDEAHQIPELASRFFGSTLSSRQCLDLAHDARTAWHDEAHDTEGFEQISYALEKQVSQLRTLFKADELRTEWHAVMNNEEIKQAFNELQRLLNELQDAIDQIAERGKELESCYQRACLLCTNLQRYLDSDDDESIRWIEVRGRGVLLHKTPLNVSSVFQNHLQHYQCYAIYTSATLSVGNRFNHFAEQLGLTNVSAETWASPFDFNQQALLYLPEQMPQPNQAEYTAAVVEQALPLLKASGGRAFMLFTSHRALREAVQLVRSRVSFPCFVQGEAAKMQLLQSFRDSQNGILLGTSSFWEGVDVKGRALSFVIIDKLPFATPDDPVLRARTRKMQEQGKNIFMEYQLPSAVIQLKQGVGRLIRDPADYGVLMICDPRIRTRAYGKTFLNSLPALRQTSKVPEVLAFFDSIR